MRRILLLITDLKIGGTPAVVRELAVRLHAPPRVIVDVACLAPWGPVADQIQARGIRVRALGASSAADPRIFPRLARLIGDGRNGHRYDTVFSFLVHANVVASAVAPFFPGVRFLQSIQTTQPRPRWHWPFQGFAQLAAEKIVVPSPSVARVAEDRSLISPEKVVIISNALELGDFEFRGNTEVGRPGRVGFIGRLDPVKRLPDLIRAIASLDDDTTLDIFGEGRERGSIERLIDDLHMSTRVRLRGGESGPREALTQMDVLVLPSEAEGFGLVLIEAMACGVPVVGTNVPGIRDVIRDGATGLLTPPGQPLELARQIERLLKDVALRGKLIAEARQDVERRFSWQNVLPAYRELLRLEEAL